MAIKTFAKGEVVDRSSPHTGPDPPKPLIPTDPSLFERNKSGVWCKRDARGAWYPVDAVGERWYNTKDKLSDYTDRPPDVNTTMWKLFDAFRNDQSVI